MNRQHLAADNVLPRGGAHTTRRIEAPFGDLLAHDVQELRVLRLAMLMDTALQVYADILKDKDHPDAFRVAKDILDRNKLFGLGTPEDTKPGHSLMVNTQVNTNVSARQTRNWRRTRSCSASCVSCYQTSPRR